MNRNISKVAVLGSGIMGSGIACHFANVGVEVLLLDIAPKELNDKEIKQGLSLSDNIVKNRIVTEMFNRCIKSKPSPIFSKKFTCLLYTSPSPRDVEESRMPSSA